MFFELLFTIHIQSSAFRTIFYDYLGLVASFGTLKP